MRITRQTIIFLAGAAVFFGAVKFLQFNGILNPYWQLVLDQALITVIAALGLSIIYGFTGQFSLGHAAFYGLGAYIAGALDKTYGNGNMLFFLLSLLAGAALAGLVALLIGLPILRLRSDYLGIATLGFGIIVKVAMENSNKLFPVLGGATGMSGTPQLAKFNLIFLFALLVILLVRNFISSTYGRACTSIREDEIAADVMGIDTTRYKVMAFVMGCTLAGLAGGIYAHRYPFLHPASFDFLKSFDFLLIVVLGGLGSMTGTIVTAVGWVFLLEGLRIILGQAFIDWRGVIYALILIVAIIVRPQGIFSGKELSLLFPRPVKTVTGKEQAHAGSGN
ncbi:branched-chain amino acid ABC transporter permease [Desulfofundulus thermobenzoicus]|uniref:Branched-chain amino acid ABC transporter permease n=1 Tax=Desulfofundulus thermobenzoicus TaxID=29376 RepID=A0A6N7IWF9_9FIRM|nr:branched-chain amino acid ABC transporter permease [Desulfofundulus thermobenzoicus]MQL53817.1 branched-chain amino acid ABC transporter permease [Desulfofundulus thermobenzoicus]